MGPGGAARCGACSTGRVVLGLWMVIGGDRSRRLGDLDAAADAIACRFPSARRPSRSSASDGRPLVSRGEMSGTDVPIKDCRLYLPAAARGAVEDRRFWHHPGFDPIGLTRAALREPPDQRTPGAGRLHSSPSRSPRTCS